MKTNHKKFLKQFSDLRTKFDAILTIRDKHIKNFQSVKLKETKQKWLLRVAEDDDKLSVIQRDYKKLIENAVRQAAREREIKLHNERMIKQTKAGMKEAKRIFDLQMAREQKQLERFTKNVVDLREYYPQLKEQIDLGVPQVPTVELIIKEEE